MSGMSRENVTFVDSHIHLSDYPNPVEVVSRAARGPTLLLAVGVDFESSEKTMELSRDFPGSVKGFVGVHPSEAGRFSDLNWLRELAEKASGIGEIGLDPNYSPGSPFDNQVKTFRQELEFAEKLGKPVQVHTRGAEKASLDMLSEFSLNRVLLHWFQGEDLISSARDRGYYISFGPSVLVSKKSQRIAAEYDPGLQLTESDGPVSFKHLGGREGPPLIPSVVFKLSEVRGESFEETLHRLRANASSYLGVGKG